jgi:hypothetical protein
LPQFSPRAFGAPSNTAARKGTTMTDRTAPARPRLRRRAWLALPLGLPLAGLGGCATWLGDEPLAVTLVGMEPLGGEGLEMRLAVRLRLQNPGETEVVWDGVSLDLDLDGNVLARGVSAQTGRLPRFGETVLTVPVSISGLAVLREVMAMARGGERTRITFGVRGRLGGGVLGGRSFSGRGELDWPFGGRATTLPSPRQP